MEKFNKKDQNLGHNESKTGLDHERKNSPKGLSSEKSESCGCKYEPNKNVSREGNYNERSENRDKNLSSSEKYRSKMTDEDYNKDNEND